MKGGPKTSRSVMFRSYHSAGSDLRLTDVTFEEHHLAISTVETS